MSLKITFYFHSNFVMVTQIDKFRTEYTNFKKIRCDVTRCTCCIVSDYSAGFPPCEGTWLCIPFFLDNKGISHTADRIFTNFKVC